MRSQAVVDQVIDDAWIGQGRGVAETGALGSISLAAILRRMRRMILPERVFGRPGAHWIRSTFGDRADLLGAHQLDQFLLQFVGRLLAPAISVT
jgi:hypothetical protein